MNDCHVMASIEMSFNSTKDVWERSEQAGSQAVNMWMEFKDPAQQQAFVSFKAAQFGKKYYTPLMAAIITVICALFWVQVMLIYPSKLAIGTCALTFAVTVPLLWILVALKQHPSALPFEQHCFQYFLLENTFMAMAVLTIALVLLMRISNGPCASMTFWQIWACSPHYGLPVESTLLALFLPLLCFKTLPTISTKAAALLCLGAIALTVGAMIQMQAIFAPVWTAVALLLMVALFVINAQMHIQLFLFVQRTQGLGQQRDEDASKQAEKMRNVIGKISHDLRTPLVAFSYGLEVMHRAIRELTSSGPAADKLHAQAGNLTNALDGMQQGYLHLMMIIDRCMDFSRLAHGLPLVPRWLPTHIGTVLDTVVDYVNKTQECAQVIVHRADEQEHIMTDATWLQDNLLCLLGNAVRLSPARSPVFLRTVLQSGPDHMLRFEVEDFGIGAEDEQAQALFHAPEGNAARASGGAGLGLFCLAERVKALHGEYGVRCKKEVSCHGTAAAGSAPGVVFWFTVPTVMLGCSPDDKPIPESSSHTERNSSASNGLNESKQQEQLDSMRMLTVPPPAEQQHDTSSMDGSAASSCISAVVPPLHVLLVDDSPLVLKMLKMMFLCKGHHVLTTTNGYEALDMLRLSFDHAFALATNAVGKLLAEPPEHLPAGFSPQEPFDVVFIDMQMPIIDGLETMREYRKLLPRYADAVLRKPMVVAMSANMDHVSMQDARAAGADAFLSKPFNMDTFNALLADHRNAAGGSSQQQRSNTEIL